MIELIGALAVIAILSALAAPAIVHSIQENRRRGEVEMMARIGEALQRVVVLYETVPATNAASWASLVASELSLPEDSVSTNGAAQPRLLVYDPALRIGGHTPGTLPFNQREGGATNLVAPRLVILSSVAEGYPAVDFTTAAGFSNLWNRAEHNVPSGWPAGYAARGDDIVVQRVDLSGLFHEVVLNNADRYAEAPYSVLTNNLTSVGCSNIVAATNRPLSTLLIHGTPLRLYEASGRPQVVTVINGNASFVFESGRWSRTAQMGVNGPGTCGALGTLVELFMSRTDWEPTARGTTPQAVVLGMYDMLCGCRDWSDAGFENENGNSKWEAPTARFVFDIAPQLMLTSQDLIGE